MASGPASPVRPQRRSAAALEEPQGVWHQSFAVRFDYPVVFTRKLLDPSNAALAWSIARDEPHRRHRCFAVFDEGFVHAWPDAMAQLQRYVDAHHETLELVAPPVSLVGGEAAKNDPTLIADLQEQFGAAGLDRHACVLVFGGGAVLDAAGYASGTTHCGLRTVRMPTTVLGQNDAGIGVKNGVNGRGTKNYLGTFDPPWAVLNDFDFIETLQPRDKVAGIAEAVKVALIRDADFFGRLEADAERLAISESAAMEAMIRRCAQLHLQHIQSSGDPFEKGSARPLDFGHWAAHKLENLSRHQLRHGEAVSIGIVLDARYSVVAGHLQPEVLERICALFETLGLPLWHDALGQRDDAGRLEVLKGLDEFREHLGGELTITLLEGVGCGVEVHDVDVDAMAGCVQWLRARFATGVPDASALP